MKRITKPIYRTILVTENGGEPRRITTHENTMTTITEKITVYSELGDSKHPNRMEISMDGSHPDCPITLWHDGIAVFSMGVDEIPEFCEQLNKLDCSNS